MNEAQTRFNDKGMLVGTLFQEVRFSWSRGDQGRVLRSHGHLPCDVGRNQKPVPVIFSRQWTRSRFCIHLSP